MPAAAKRSLHSAGLRPLFVLAYTYIWNRVESSVARFLDRIDQSARARSASDRCIARCIAINNYPLVAQAREKEKERDRESFAPRINHADHGVEWKNEYMYPKKNIYISQDKRRTIMNMNIYTHTHAHICISSCLKMSLSLISI